jgi:hypothetical protein
MVSAQERFIVVPCVLTDAEQMIILTDFHYWADHENELREWCWDNSSAFVGMTVVFPNKPTLTAFCLTWS